MNKNEEMKRIIDILKWPPEIREACDEYDRMVKELKQFREELKQCEGGSDEWEGTADEIENLYNEINDLVVEHDLDQYGRPELERIL